MRPKAAGAWLLHEHTKSLPLDHFVRIVLCMLLFAPMPSMTAGFVAEAKNDVELSTFITSLSIVVGIVVMPLILVVLGG